MDGSPPVAGATNGDGSERFPRVQWRIVVRELPLLLLLFAGLLIWVEHQQTRALRASDLELTRMSAAAAVSAIEASMVAGDAPGIWERLSQKITPKSAFDVRVVDAQGAVVHATDPERVGHVYGLDDPPCASCHEDGSGQPSARSRFLRGPGDERTTLYAVSLHNADECRACHAGDGDTLGMVYVQHPFRQAETLIRRTRGGLLAGGAVAYLLSLLVAGFVLHRHIDLPVMHLLKGAREIGAGHLDSNVELPERGELSVLADALNRSTRELQESIQQIEYQRDDLQMLYDIADELGQTVEPEERRHRAVELVGTIFHSDCVLIAGYVHAESGVFHGTVTYRDRRSEIVERPFHEGDAGPGVPFYTPGSVERWLRGELDGVFRVRDGKTVVFPLERRGRRLGLIMAPAVERGEYADGRVTATNPLVVRAFLRHLAIALDLSELQREHLRQGRLAAIGGVVAGISHCLKNTLNGLRGGLYVVERARETDNPQRLDEGWAVLTTSVQQIERLSLNMLYFSRDHRPKMEDVDPNRILQEIVDLLTQTAAARGVTVRADLDPDIGRMWLDRLGIYRAVLNLVTNAVDACVEAETGGGTVLVRSRASDDELRIDVEDDGVGMSERTQKRMYEQFFSTKAGQGTGLGLPVVKKILDEHGGTMRVTSTLGEGTTFVIRLPRRDRRST